MKNSNASACVYTFPYLHIPSPFQLSALGGFPTAFSTKSIPHHKTNPLRHRGHALQGTPYSWAHPLARHPALQRDQPAPIQSRGDKQRSQQDIVCFQPEPWQANSNDSDQEPNWPGPRSSPPRSHTSSSMLIHRLLDQLDIVPAAAQQPHTAVTNQNGMHMCTDH